MLNQRDNCSCLFSQDYETFFNAKEDNSVYAFLGLPPPPGSKVGLFSLFLSESASITYSHWGSFCFEVFGSFPFQFF